ncbi:MAG: TolC family protein, partial [Pseudomonadota bacterium]|nr:TolC family protein [Pseudomonadota bacterium]
MLTLLAGCTVGPDYHPASAAQLGVPTHYSRAGATSARQESIGRWWGRSNDPLMRRLVEEALGGNLDLAQALARIQQSRESLVQARAARVPTISATGGAGETVDQSGNRTSSFSMQGGASWEADLFGGTKRSIESTSAEAAASVYDWAGVRVTTAGDVATAYVRLRITQQRAAVARTSLLNATDNRVIAQWRLRAGLVSSSDVEQARSTEAQTAAT